nr:T9SS type A sorting domain-containing protein [Salinivirgaceae bacterium]
TSTYTGSVAFRFFLGASNIVTYFDDVEIIEEPTVNVNVISANLSNEVIMFPNPATDILNVHVRTKYNEKVAISIIDLQGRVLSTKRYVATSEGINTFQFDVQTISQGNYLVKVSTLASATSKIIVIKR